MQKNTHQAHVMIGTRAYDVNDSRRMPLYLLNNMLGGPGMNAVEPVCASTTDWFTP